MNNKLNLDLLVVDTHNPQTLGIADTSFYPLGLQIITPSIQITPPSYPKITLPFASQNLTIYNSNILGITCIGGDCNGTVDLPDGIWKLKYTIAPANERLVEKSFMRTEKIQQQWGIAFLSAEIKGCDSRLNQQQKDELDTIFDLIQGAIASANQCNDISAMNKYRLAQSLLNKFIKNYN
jgi:hypothetical protein